MEAATPEQSLTVHSWLVVITFMIVIALVIHPVRIPLPIPVSAPSPPTASATVPAVNNAEAVNNQPGEQQQQPALAAAASITTAVGDVSATANNAPLLSTTTAITVTDENFSVTAKPPKPYPYYIPINIATAPVLGVLFLLATRSIEGNSIRDGIVGAPGSGVEPYAVMILFFSLVSGSMGLSKQTVVYTP